MMDANVDLGMRVAFLSYSRMIDADILFQDKILIGTGPASDGVREDLENRKL
jgi:hypothetical protein